MVFLYELPSSLKTRQEIKTMATIAWHENEKIGVCDENENEESFIELGENGETVEYEGILSDSEFKSEIVKILEIPESEISLQSGIKYKYAWQVDENGNL